MPTILMVVAHISRGPGVASVPPMQFRTKETLHRWVEEFIATRGAGEKINVVVHDADEGHDTGLVVVPLSDASTSIYMQPAEPGHHQWRITLEPRHDTAVLDHHRLNALAVELLVAAELCAYLEAKSVGHTEELVAGSA